MSLRAASPPPRATTPEPTIQPLPSPRLRPTRSIRQLKPLAASTNTTALSSHDEFHLTFDEFGTDHRKFCPSPPDVLAVYHSSADSPKTRSPPHRTRRKSGPTSPLPHNTTHHHKLPRRSGSPPPPAHHHPTPPPPLPPLPSFLVSAARKPTNDYGFDIPDISIFHSPPSSTSSTESVNCYHIYRSTS